MNGQIQYGSARPLTFHPTVLVRAPRTTDPGRFAAVAVTGRPVVLLLGSSLLLGLLLTTVPREIPGVALAVVLGGAWLSLVLVMTLPRQSELAGRELVRRLAQFRHELNAIGDSPSRETLERLIQRVSELDLEEQEVIEELAQIRASLDAIDLESRLAAGQLPAADAPDPMAPGDTCHFVAPVRFGRRRADQFGHLVLSRGWLKFRGALDVSVSWSEIAAVTRAGREILISLQDSKRLLRFSCNSYSEAARGGVLAQHLAHAARAVAASPTDHYEASI